MAQAQTKRMTADEFFIWHTAQQGKYELVDGMPVPHRAMTGGRVINSRIASNTLGHLFMQLRGSPCIPLGSDTAIRTAIDQVRYPDILIDCSPLDPNAFDAPNPIALFEVLSPTTRKTDQHIKLADYIRHPTLQTIVFIDPDLMDVISYARDGLGHWQLTHHVSASDCIAIKGTAASLALADIYEGVAFDAAS